jgi:hypothetical protein
MSTFFRGRVKLGACKRAGPNLIHLTFECGENPPLGHAATVPDDIGATILDHTRGESVGLHLYELQAGDTDHKRHAELTLELAMHGGDGQPVKDCVDVGQCVLIRSTAKRNRKGRAYLFTVAAHQPSTDRRILTRAMMGGSMVLAAMVDQYVLPLADKPVKRKGKKSWMDEKPGDLFAPKATEGPQAAPSATEVTKAVSVVGVNLSEPGGDHSVVVVGSIDGDGVVTTEKAIDLTNISTKALLAIATEGADDPDYLAAVTAELNRREPAKPNAADDLLDAVQGQQIQGEQGVEPSMAERSTKAKRRGKLALV